MFNTYNQNCKNQSTILYLISPYCDYALLKSMKHKFLIAILCFDI